MWYLNVGIQVLIGEDQLALCKAKVLFTSLDLPAKAKVLEFTQFNGRYGCAVCKEEGIVVRVGRGSTRVYPYSDNLSLRDHNESAHFGRRALADKEVC